MSDDGLSGVHTQVRTIVVRDQDTTDLWDLSRRTNRQITELLASLQLDLSQLYEPVRQLSQALQENLQLALLQVAEASSITGLAARQQPTTAVAPAFTPLPVPTPQELWEADAALRERLPRTAEQVEQAKQLSETIEADPRQREMIKRMRDALKQADLSGVAPIALSALLYWWLCHALNLPLTGEGTSAQTPDYLAVITLVITVLFGLRPRS
jgi:hypothetical protein